MSATMSKDDMLERLRTLALELCELNPGRSFYYDKTGATVSTVDNGRTMRLYCGYQDATGYGIVRTF